MTKTESRTPARRSRRQNVFALTASMCLAIVSLSGSGNPPASPQAAVQAELQSLSARGITYRFIADSIIELHDEYSGTTFVRSLKSQNDDELRLWARAKGVPILEIDPRLIDTSIYSGRYSFWARVPLSNVSLPLVCGDLDHNGRIEAYGVYRDSTNNVDRRAYEIDSTGTANMLHSFAPYEGVARSILDSDGDSLWEVIFTSAGYAYDFEQLSTSQIPTELNFTHNRYQGNLTPGSTGIVFEDLDGDGVLDFLYKGSEPDTTDPNVGIGKVYVAEFDSAQNNFARVWSKQFYQNSESAIAGFSVSDFDGDERQEFLVTGGLLGHVFIIENSGDDSFSQAWMDSLPLVNLYYQCAGDVDDDGKVEFFVGATTGTGNWIIMYESDHNNHYVPKIIFHLLSGGLFNEPTYEAIDMDGDGKPELVLMCGTDIYVFKSSMDDGYALWFLWRVGTGTCMRAKDVNNDKRSDLLISKLDQGGRIYTDIYVAANIMLKATAEEEVEEKGTLLCYPNPFNSSIELQITAPVGQAVTLRVFNILGQEIARPLDGILWKGKDSIEWNATNLPSGMYICLLETQVSLIARKILLVR